MKVIETEAIILKNYSLAEADKIVLCLTREAGLVRLSVRGAKRLRSRFCGRLEPFTVADVVYGQKEETELGNLFQAEVAISYFHLAKRLNVLSALFYLTEILVAITPPDEPNETLYRMVKTCFSAIDEEREDLFAIRLITIYFEIWLLRLGGFLPDFKTCNACRTGVSNAPFYYSANEGSFLCSKCAGQRNELFSPHLLKVLRTALIAPPLKFVQTTKKLQFNLASLENITHRLFRKLLEYEPQYWATNFDLEEKAEQIKKVA